MSRRNDYDYFDLDNFDDSIDSREYRRRQQQRRPASYAARPSSQRPARRPVKEETKKNQKQNYYRCERIDNSVCYYFYYNFNF